MRLRLYQYLIICLVFPLLAHADESLITLKDLEQEALRNNPEILMAGKRTESALERKSLAAAMPDPMIGYEIKNVGALGTSTVGVEEMSMQGFVFSQEIPFPGKLGAKGNAAAMAAERERAAAHETVLKVLSSLRTAYYDYYFASKSIEILTQTKDLMKNFERIAESRYATGQGTQQDVLRAQLEIAMLLDRIAEQEQKKEAQAALLNSLVGRDPLADIGKPADLPHIHVDANVNGLAAKALDHSPVLEGRKRMVEQSEFELSMSRREFLPDMVVSAGRFTRGDLKDVYEASIMFKVPLYFWNKSTAVTASHADVLAAKYDYDAARLMTLARVREVASLIKASEHHLHSYSLDIIPQARLAVQSTTSNYQVGKTDFLSLLDSESLLLKYQLMEQEELVNLNKNLSMVKEITGDGE